MVICMEARGHAWSCWIEGGAILTGAEVVMVESRLPVTPPVVSDFQGVDSQIKDDGRSGLNEEYAFLGGNIKS
jgi:hypothetical protein